jgi:hypothetical protein
MYIQKIISKKLRIFFTSWSLAKFAGSGSISQRYGSADPDPDPYQNFIDPQHYKILKQYGAYDKDKTSIAVNK